MKTREQIYGKEAAALLRDITTYHCMKPGQILKLYPGKERQVENLLTHLTRQGRIFYDPILTIRICGPILKCCLPFGYWQISAARRNTTAAMSSLSS